MFVGRKNILLSSEYQHVVFAATEEELILCERVRLVTVLMFILGAAAATTFRRGSNIHNRPQSVVCFVQEELLNSDQLNFHIQTSRHRII